MSFTLNGKITTELTVEEVSAIAVACGEYLRLYANIADLKTARTMLNLTNRLGRELYDHPDNDKPNGH